MEVDADKLARLHQAVQFSLAIDFSDIGAWFRFIDCCVHNKKSRILICRSSNAYACSTNLCPIASHSITWTGLSVRITNLSLFVGRVVWCVTTDTQCICSLVAWSSDSNPTATKRRYSARRGIFTYGWIGVSTSCKSSSTVSSISNSSSCNRCDILYIVLFDYHSLGTRSISLGLSRNTISCSSRRHDTIIRYNEFGIRILRIREEHCNHRGHVLPGWLTLRLFWVSIQFLLIVIWLNGLLFFAVSHLALHVRPSAHWGSEHKQC